MLRPTSFISPLLPLPFLLSFFLRLDRGSGYGAFAQSFSIPTTWRKPISPLSQQDRRSIVDGLVGTILPNFNSSSGLLDGLTITQTASLIVALSNSDWVSGLVNNKATVMTSIGTVFSQNPNISSVRPRIPIMKYITLPLSYLLPSNSLQVVNSDPAIWGLAAISAYRAYKDVAALQHAQAMWTLLETYMITNEDAARGMHPTKEALFESNCNGASTAGGVFYLPSSTQNTDVNGETVGAFMALSAHLYTETVNTTYLAAATLSASFIFHQLFDDSIILDTITLANCLTNQDIVTYNSGFVVEGLSLLANVKDIGDISPGTTYQGFLENLISTTIPNRNWTNATDGVIIEGPADEKDAETNSFEQALKGIFVRGLYEAYNLTSPGSSMASYISSFITVQFNSIQDRACGGRENDLYSSRWEGPPPIQMQPWGQLAALDVLNAAVGIFDPIAVSNGNNSNTAPVSVTDTTSVTTPSSTPTGPAGLDSSHQRKHSSSRTAIIAGSLAGALALLILITIVALYTTRTSRKRPARERNTLTAITPFFNTDRRRELKGWSSRRQEVMVVSTERQNEQRRGGHPHMGNLALNEPESTSPHTSHDDDGHKEAPTTTSTNTSDPPPLNLVIESLGPEAAVANTANGEQARSLSTELESPSTSELPELLDRLNRILLRLPPGGPEVFEEDPPEYED